MTPVPKTRRVNAIAALVLAAVLIGYGALVLLGFRRPSWRFMMALARADAGPVAVAILLAVLPMLAWSGRSRIALAAVAAIPSLEAGVQMVQHGQGVAFLGVMLFGMPPMCGVSARGLSLALNALSHGRIRRPASLCIEAIFLGLAIALVVDF